MSESIVSTLPRASVDTTIDVGPTERIDRHDPVGKRDYLSQQHVGRYRFATERLRAGMRVLDAACGTAYGTELLLGRGCVAIGGDIDTAQLTAAKRARSGDDYVSFDVLDTPFPDASFDAIVSFETIEHVVDGQRFLDEMHRILRPGGTLICSTPNIAYTSHPAYHLHEYRPEEYYRLVEARFASTERHAQYFTAIDRLQDRLQFMPPTSRTWVRLARYPLELLGKALRRVRGTGSGDGAARACYGVAPCRGDRLLRIMVTVSTKS